MSFSSPFGGGSTGFGAPSSLSFGQPSGFGSASPSPFGGSSTTAASPFGSTTNASPFGSTPAATSGFGSTGFGSSTSSGLFGQSSTSTFGSTNTGFGSTSTTSQPFGGGGGSAFGSTATSPFGAASSSPFGAPAASTTSSIFGAPSTSTQVSPFGAPSTSGSIFGGSQTPQTTSTLGQSTLGASPFGSTSTTSPFGAATSTAAASPFAGGSSFGAFGAQQQQGTASTPYAETQDPDSSSSRIMTITAMPAYQSKSQEELRFEDYAAGRKGNPNAPVVNATSTGFAATSSPFGGGSAFGTSSGVTSSSPFGASTGFSSSSPFGTSTTASPFGAASTSTPFGATQSGFGASSSTASPFGAPATTSAFGANTTGGGFGGFGSSTGGTSAFGTTGSSTGFGFGTTPASTSAFGATGQSGSLFGSTASSTASTPFSFSTPSTTNTGGFGSGFGATTTPSTGSGFGATATSTPFGATPTSGGLFGSTGGAFGSTQPTTGGSLFGGGTGSTSSGLFGPSTSAAGATGTTGGGLFGATAGTGTGAFGTTGTGGSLFGGAGATGAAGGGLFGNTGAASNGQFNFGGSTSSTGTGSTGGSLFGGFGAGSTSTATPGGSSLFGSTTAQTGTGGSLFGGSGGSSSSLFGGSSSSTGFGSSLGSTGSGGSLFGGLGSSSTPSGSLFGSTPSASGSLFGSAGGLAATGQQQQLQLQQLQQQQAQQAALVASHKDNPYGAGNAGAGLVEQQVRAALALPVGRDGTDKTVGTGLSQSAWASNTTGGASGGNAFSGNGGTASESADSAALVLATSSSSLYGRRPPLHGHARIRPRHPFGDQLGLGLPSALPGRERKVGGDAGLRNGVGRDIGAGLRLLSPDVFVNRQTKRLVIEKERVEEEGEQEEGDNDASGNGEDQHLKRPVPLSAAKSLGFTESSQVLSLPAPGDDAKAEDDFVSVTVIVSKRGRKQEASEKDTVQVSLRRTALVREAKAAVLERLKSGRPSNASEAALYLLLTDGDRRELRNDRAQLKEVIGEASSIQLEVELGSEKAQAEDSANGATSGRSSSSTVSSFSTPSFRDVEDSGRESSLRGGFSPGSASASSSRSPAVVPAGHSDRKGSYGVSPSPGGALATLANLPLGARNGQQQQVVRPTPVRAVGEYTPIRGATSLSGEVSGKYDRKAPTTKFETYEEFYREVLSSQLRDSAGKEQQHGRSPRAIRPAEGSRCAVGGGRGALRTVEADPADDSDGAEEDSYSQNGWSAGAGGGGDENGAELEDPAEPSDSDPEGSLSGAVLNPSAPRLLRPGYFTVPAYQRLCRMSDNALSSVRDFAVGRSGCGKVTWPGKTDLRGLDLDSIIELNRKEVVVYQDEDAKPEEGQELNKEAVVELLGVYPTEDTPEGRKRYSERVARRTERQGAELLEYSPYTGVWRFRVKHFSRYGLDDDSEDEEEVSSTRPSKLVGAKENLQPNFGGKSLLSREGSKKEKSTRHRRRARGLTAPPRSTLALAVAPEAAEDDDQDMEEGEEQQDEEEEEQGSAGAKQGVRGKATTTTSSSSYGRGAGGGRGRRAGFSMDSSDEGEDERMAEDDGVAAGAGRGGRQPQEDEEEEEEEEEGLEGPAFLSAKLGLSVDRLQRLQSSLFPNSRQARSRPQPRREAEASSTANGGARSRGHSGGRGGVGPAPHVSTQRTETPQQPPGQWVSAQPGQRSGLLGGESLPVNAVSLPRPPCLEPAAFVPHARLPRGDLRSTAGGEADETAGPQSESWRIFRQTGTTGTEAVSGSAFPRAEFSVFLGSSFRCSWTADGRLVRPVAPSSRAAAGSKAFSIKIEAPLERAARVERGSEELMKTRNTRVAAAEVEAFMLVHLRAAEREKERARKSRREVLDRRHAQETAGANDMQAVNGDGGDDDDEHGGVPLFHLPSGLALVSTLHDYMDASRAIFENQKKDSPGSGSALQRHRKLSSLHSLLVWKLVNALWGQERRPSCIRQDGQVDEAQESLEMANIVPIVDDSRDRDDIATYQAKDQRREAISHWLAETLQSDHPFVRRASASSFLAALWRSSEGDARDRLAALREAEEDLAKNDEQDHDDVHSSSTTLAARSEEDVFDRIFDHLVKLRVEDAAELAMRHGNSRLALLIAQARCFFGEDYRELLKEQLSEWEATGASEHISPRLLRIFCLLSGEVDEVAASTLPWLQALAMPLWYRQGPGRKLAAALTEYVRAVSSRRAPPPLPHYLWESRGPARAEAERHWERLWLGQQQEQGHQQAQGQVKTARASQSSLWVASSEKRRLADGSWARAPALDVVFHLMQLFVDHSHPLRAVLSPAANSADPMDFRMSWHLCCVLEGLGLEVDPSLKASIQSSFIQQLEAMGLWHWAIYVALNLPDAGVRAKYVKEILVQVVSSDTWREDGGPAPKLASDEKDEDDRGTVAKRRAFITDRLGVPAEWVEEALAIRSRYDDRYADEIAHLIAASKWKEAHECVVVRVAPSCIFYNDYAVLRRILEEIDACVDAKSEITEWDRYGGLYLEYLNILEYRGSDLEELMSRIATVSQKLSEWEPMRFWTTAENRKMERVSVSSMQNALSERAMLIKAEITKGQEEQMDGAVWYRSDSAAEVLHAPSVLEPAFLRQISSAHLNDAFSESFHGRQVDSLCSTFLNWRGNQQSCREQQV